MIILLIILRILLYTLLFILGLAMLLLLIPFNYSGRVMTAEGFRAQVRFGWARRFLGITAEIDEDAVDITFRIMDKRVYKLKRKEAVEEKPEKKPEEKENKTGSKLGIRDIANKALLAEVLDYIKRVLDIAKPRYFHLYGTFGFEDPSLTGIFCGAAQALRGLIPNARLCLTPDFTREIFSLDACIAGSIRAGSLAYQTVRTVLKKPVREILFSRKKTETF